MSEKFRTSSAAWARKSQAVRKVIPIVKFYFFRHSIPNFLAQPVSPPEEKAWIAIRQYNCAAFSLQIESALPFADMEECR
jgi:hypothetical protein